jgi:hypothetical protein
LRIVFKQLVGITVVSFVAMLTSAWQEPLGIGLPAARDASAQEPPFEQEELIRSILNDAGVEASIQMLIPGEGIVFELDPERPFTLASVAKILVMTSYLEQVGLGHILPGPDDPDDLQSMIEVSDNNATDRIWRQIGSDPNIERFIRLRQLSISGPANEKEWGTMASGAGEIARVLGELYEGDALSGVATQRALNLLGSVDPAQSWGVSRGVAAGSRIFLKNGWISETIEDGWLVNSAGVIQPPAPGRPYVLVILSQGAPTLELGVETVERIAALLNGTMVRRSGSSPIGSQAP